VSRVRLRRSHRLWAAALPVAAGLLIPLIAGITPGRATTSASSVAQLKIMNYYPANAGWGQMWSNWQPSVIAADFSRIVSLNANTVRLIVQTSAFGYPVPSATMQGELSQAVSMAASAGLKVQLTLFDGFSSWSDIAGSQQWAQALLGPYNNDSRIAFIEVQNEVNPYVAAQMAWVQQLIPYVRTLGGGIPVTVSVCGCDNTGDLGDLKRALATAPPDFWDFHYYGGSNPQLAGVSVAQALSVFLQAQQIATPLPLIIGETGYSTLTSNATVSGLPLTQASQEAFQSQFYNTVAQAALQARLPAPAPWMLNDFTSSGCSCATVERYFGLYRADGTLKPAGTAIQNIFGSGSVDTSFNNGFENSGGLCTCASSLSSAIVPANWRLSGTGYASFARDTTVAHSGRASAMITASTVMPGGARPSYFLSPVIGVSPVIGPVEGQHTLTAWVKGTLTTGSTVIEIHWWDAAGYHSLSSAPLQVGTTDWTPLSVVAVFSSSTVTTQLFLSSALNAGTVWFDDVNFT